MKQAFKVSELTKADLIRLGKRNKKKLAELKAQGWTKEQCYRKFTKVFVDKNY